MAFAAPSYALLGVTMHFAISIVWGVILARVAAAMPALVRRPVASGLLYGVVVMFGMTLLLSIKHLAPAQDAVGLVKSSIAHTVFFGIPVALFVSKSIRA